MTDNNPRAFPLYISDEDGSYYKGMTLRDWFAGQAISGAAFGALSDEKVANSAYRLAAAMLKAREATGE